CVSWFRVRRVEAVRGSASVLTRGERTASILDVVRVLLFLLCCAAAACCGANEAGVPAAAATAKNLVIITIDTLRADHLGAYGYGVARTPAADGLARAAPRFTRAYATAPITLPSHASLMTGRYPAGHGARHNGI